MPKKVDELKRKREKQIQSWFDPTVPAEKSVIDVFEKLRAEDWTAKEIVGNGLLALAERLGSNTERLIIPDTQISGETQRSLLTLFAAIEHLNGMVSNGVALPISAQDAVSELNRAREDFGAIETSMASRYQPLKFDDND